MPEVPKTCVTCRHRFVLPDQPSYARCRKWLSGERDDAALCGQMRQGTCGPDATLWESKDG